MCIILICRGKYRIMKIIAHFDSPDSADFAAGALKNALSSLSSVEAKEYHAKSAQNNMNIFTAFNTTATSPTYSMPMYNPAAYASANDDSGRDSDYSADAHVVEVICRKEDAATASRIIIGHGGRNISRLS